MGGEGGVCCGSSFCAAIVEIDGSVREVSRCHVRKLHHNEWSNLSAGDAA